VRKFFRRGKMGKILKKIKQILLEALGGFIFWTGCLTPYMIFIVHTSVEQYFKWFFMQLLIVPPLAPLSIRFIKWFVNILRRNK